VNTSQQDKQNYEQQHPNSQATAQQDKSSYEQQHPNSQPNAQQDKQNMSQNRSSGGYSSENLDSERQDRPEWIGAEPTLRIVGK
jgi:hypothetical protein